MPYFVLSREEQAADKHQAEKDLTDLRNSSMEGRKFLRRIVQGGSSLLSYSALYVTLSHTGAGIIQGLDTLELVQLVTVVNIIGACVHPTYILYS